MYDIGEYISERSRGGDCHLLMAHRVFKGKKIGVKADAPVRIGAGIPIFEVAFDGAAYVCQLAPYLVMASGVQLYL